MGASLQIIALPEPALKADGESYMFPSLFQLLAHTFTSSEFQHTFIIGFLIFLGLELIGCLVFKCLVPAEQQTKIQMEQFAGIWISMWHSLMIGTASALVVSSIDPWESINSENSDFKSVIIYQTCATFSLAYFTLDTLIIITLYETTRKSKLAFSIHHVLSGVCMCPVQLAPNPFIPYLSSLNFLIEWSTVLLNLRIFARTWSCKRLYFIAGLGVLISYPLTRIVWNLWLIYISFSSPYLAYYTVPEASFIACTAQICVALLSSCYYFRVIMKNIPAMYKLEWASDHLHHQHQK